MKDELYFPMYITIIVIAVLALLLNFIVITASLLSKKKTKNDFFYAVIHLLIISTFHSLSFCLNWFKDSKGDLIYENMTLCKTQSFFITFTTLTEGMAVAMILWACYNSSKEENEEETDDGEGKRKKTAFKKLTFLTLTYFVPLLFSVLGIFFKIYDKATMYCWVTATHDSSWKPIAITIICVPYLIVVLL